MIKSLLAEFVSYVTCPGAKDDAALLALCDRIVSAYHEVTYTFDNRDLPDPPRSDAKLRRAGISALFPDYGLYSLTHSKLEDIEAGAMVGDAIDDLVDLSQDFEAVLWCMDHTSVDDALWHFVNGYTIHWGQHIRELQLFLFRKVVGT